MLLYFIPGLVSSALSKFSVPDAVKIVRLKGSLSILELFHGKTLAFKDLAMTCTIRFLEYFLRKDNRRATVLVGNEKHTEIKKLDKVKHYRYICSQHIPLINGMKTLCILYRNVWGYWKFSHQQCV